MINEIIKNSRKSENLTAKQLALKLNVSTSLIYEWEHGRSNPSIDDLIKLADLFGFTVDYLIGRTDEEGNLIKVDYSLSPDEERLLRAFRSLDNSTKDKLLSDAEFYVGRKSSERKNTSNNG